MQQQPQPQPQPQPQGAATAAGPNRSMNRNATGAKTLATPQSPNSRVPLVQNSRVPARSSVLQGGGGSSNQPLQRPQSSHPQLIGQRHSRPSQGPPTASASFRPWSAGANTGASQGFCTVEPSQAGALGAVRPMSAGGNVHSSPPPGVYDRSAGPRLAAERGQQISAVGSQQALRSGGLAAGSFVMPALQGAASPPRQPPTMSTVAASMTVPDSSGLVTLENLPDSTPVPPAGGEVLSTPGAALQPQQQRELASPGRPLSQQRPSRTSLTKVVQGLPSTAEAAQSLKLFAFGAGSGTMPVPAEVLTTTAMQQQQQQQQQQQKAGQPISPCDSTLVTTLLTTRQGTGDDLASRREAAVSSGSAWPVAASAQAEAPMTAEAAAAIAIATMPLMPSLSTEAVDATPPLATNSTVADEGLDETRQVPRMMKEIQFKVAEGMRESASRQAITSAFQVLGQQLDENAKPSGGSGDASTAASSEGLLEGATSANPEATPPTVVSSSSDAAPGGDAATVFAVAKSSYRVPAEQDDASAFAAQGRAVADNQQRVLLEHIRAQDAALQSMQAALLGMKADREQRQQKTDAALLQLRQQLDTGLSKVQAAMAAWPTRHDLMVASVHALQNQISDLACTAAPLSGDNGLAAQVHSLQSERRSLHDGIVAIGEEQESLRSMLMQHRDDLAQMSCALGSMPASEAPLAATADELEELQTLREEVTVVTTAVKALCDRVDEMCDSNIQQQLQVEMGTLASIVSDLSERVDKLSYNASVPPHHATASQLRPNVVADATTTSARSYNNDGVTATAQALRERLARLLREAQRDAESDVVKESDSAVQEEVNAAYITPRVLQGAADVHRRSPPHSSNLAAYSPNPRMWAGEPLAT